jgi:hypothetical protein
LVSCQAPPQRFEELAPSSDYCGCSGCGARFQSQSGLTVTNWRAVVLAAGALRNAFLDWRRAEMTRLVAAVHAAVKALKPVVFSISPVPSKGTFFRVRVWL